MSLIQFKTLSHLTQNLCFKDKGQVVCQGHLPVRKIQNNSTDLNLNKIQKGSKWRKTLEFNGLQLRSRHLKLIMFSRGWKRLGNKDLLLSLQDKDLPLAHLTFNNRMFKRSSRNR
jgi:hypothetical protein